MLAIFSEVEILKKICQLGHGQVRVEGKVFITAKENRGRGGRVDGESVQKALHYSNDGIRSLERLYLPRNQKCPKEGKTNSLDIH